MENLEKLLSRSGETINQVEKTKTALAEMNKKVEELKREEGKLVVNIADLHTERDTAIAELKEYRRQLKEYQDLTKENEALKAENKAVKEESMKIITATSLAKLEHQIQDQEKAAAIYQADEAKRELAEILKRVSDAEGEEKKTNSYFLRQLQRVLDEKKIKVNVLEEIKL